MTYFKAQFWNIHRWNEDNIFRTWNYELPESYAEMRNSTMPRSSWFTGLFAHYYVNLSAPELFF